MDEMICDFNLFDEEFLYGSLTQRTDTKAEAQLSENYDAERKIMIDDATYDYDYDFYGQVDDIDCKESFKNSNNGYFQENNEVNHCIHSLKSLLIKTF